MSDVIYRPKGMAREYSDWACNLYRGCPHACVYCYAPSVLRMTKEAFHAQALPRKDILKKLKKDAVKLEPCNVFLCFTCDPYPQAERTHEITRAAIEILHQAGHSITVLTKNPTFAYRDAPLYWANDWFGTTLTFTPESRYASNIYEPNAEMPHQRIMGLKAFADRGIKTWVSLEPVISATDTLNLIYLTHKFVNLYKVGKLNYQKSDIDWHKFAQDVTRLLDRLGANYVLKESLKAELEKE